MLHLENLLYLEKSIFFYTKINFRHIKAQNLSSFYEYFLHINEDGITARRKLPQLLEKLSNTPHLKKCNGNTTAIVIPVPKQQKYIDAITSKCHIETVTKRLKVISGHTTAVL